jgi:ataxin-10
VVKIFIHADYTFSQLLVKTKVGVRMCIGLLDNMVKLHEAEEGSEGAKAFDIGYLFHLVTQCALS